jgi:ABC-2 type transport system ATP-binding protein
MSMIVFQNVSKVFDIKQGKKTVSQMKALDNISLSIQKGEFFTVVGPNGAGKTTLSKIVANLLLADEGHVYINHTDVQKNPNKVKRSVGFCMRADRSIYWKLTGRQNLEYFGALYGLYGKDLKDAIEKAVKDVDLKDRIDDYVERYSSGMKQRIGLAVSMLHDPDILVLDEPTTGLDPGISSEIRKTIRRMVDNEGKTVLFTTHMLHEAQQISDRVAILNQGRIVVNDTPAQLIETIKPGMVLEMKVIDFNKDFLHTLKQYPSVTDLYYSDLAHNELLLRISCSHEENIHEIIAFVSNHCRRLKDIKKEKASLEDVFISVVNEGIDDDGNAYTFKH